MKKLFTTLTMAAVMGSTAFAADFTYQGLVYTVVDATEHTCELADANWKLDPLPYGNIVIPEKVMNDGEEYTVVAAQMAFNANRAITSVTFPESVKTLGMWCLNAAESCTTIIANGVTTIEESAIQNCAALTDLQIANVKTIDGYGISDCYALRELVLPSTLTNPKNGAIMNLTGLKKVTLGAGVADWTAAGVFSHCDNIEEVIFTEDVTKVAQNIFSGMGEVRSVTCKATTPPEIPAGLFKSNVYAQAGLFVPAASVDAYKNDAVWSKFTDIFPIAATVDEPVILLNESAVRGIPTETVQLTASIFPDEVVDKTVTWTSSNEAVATVDANGLVTFVAVGDAEITASIPKAEAQCAVKVVAKNITLNITKTTESINSTLQLEATINPADGDETITWTSSNEEIATVDDKGLVTIGGTTGVVTITAAIPGVEATCVINAQVIAVTEFSVSPTTLTGEVGSTAQITATFVPANATDKTVQWYVQDEQIATCDADGLVTFVAEGSTAMFANCAGFSRMITISVTPKKDNGVEAVEAADADCEYYDLQGRRVMNPEKGIYLRKAAGKTTKVVL